MFLSLLLEFSIFHISHFQYNMSWCRYIWFILFGMLYICLFLLQDWEYFNYNLIKYVFNPFPLSYLLLNPCNGNIDMLDIIQNILYSIIIF